MKILVEAGRFQKRGTFLFSFLSSCFMSIRNRTELWQRKRLRYIGRKNLDSVDDKRWQLPTSPQEPWTLGFQPPVMWFSYERYRLRRKRSLESLRVVPRKLWNSACFFDRKTTFVFPIYARCCIVAFTTRPWSFRASLITEGICYLLFQHCRRLEHEQVLYVRTWTKRHHDRLCSYSYNGPQDWIHIWYRGDSRVPLNRILYFFFFSAKKRSSSTIIPINPHTGGKKKEHALTIRTPLNNRSRKP